MTCYRRDRVGEPGPGWEPGPRTVGWRHGPADRDQVSARFEELDWQSTPIGEISLRRRHDPAFNTEVFEVKLGDEYLMSSLFTAAEQELATLALARLHGSSLEVAVGGLGLGYTAVAALDDDRVASMVIVEVLEPVIDWHRRGLVPSGSVLTSDPRCRFVSGDFIAMAVAGSGLDPQVPDRAFDAIIVDIDHSPSQVLHPSHAALYTPDGLRLLARYLRPSGVFGLWSNDPPESGFTGALGQVFDQVDAEVVRFANPLQGREATNTVYLAQHRRG